MPLLELAHLVKRMREKQKQFFRGARSAQVVAEAKDLERKVDQALSEILHPPRPSLFDATAEESA